MRTQATIFACVLKKPIVLANLKEDSRGYIEVEKELIKPPESLELDVEIKNIATLEEFCADSMTPLYQYLKYAARGYEIE